MITTSLSFLILISKFFSVYSNEDNILTPVNVKCKCVSDICQYADCILRPIRRRTIGLDVIFILNELVSDVTANFAIRQKALMVPNNSYRTLFNASANLCSILDGKTYDILLTPGLKILQKYGAMECPIQPNKTYTWNGVESMTDNVPSLVPTGRYMAELKIFANGKEFFNYIGVADIKHNLLINW